MMEAFSLSRSVTARSTRTPPPPLPISRLLPGRRSQPLPRTFMLLARSTRSTAGYALLVGGLCFVESAPRIPRGRARSPDPAADAEDDDDDDAAATRSSIAATTRSPSRRRRAMSSFTRSMAPRILADATLVPRRSPSATASATAARFRSTRADDKEAAEDETAEDGDAIVSSSRARALFSVIAQAHTLLKSTRLGGEHSPNISAPTQHFTFLLPARSHPEPHPKKPALAAGGVATRRCREGYAFAVSEGLLNRSHSATSCRSIP